MIYRHERMNELSQSKTNIMAAERNFQTHFVVWSETDFIAAHFLQVCSTHARDYVFMCASDYVFHMQIQRHAVKSEKQNWNQVDISVS